MPPKNMLTKKLIHISLFSVYTSSILAFSAEEPVTIAPAVVVTATRVEQNSFDLPVAIDVVGKDNIQKGQLQMTLSESLIRVPGITAQNRTQSAQDPQISTRGFGARSAFGVRGLRVYVDGIPLTMPDGIGQPGVVDLSVIRAIEVMRGPFSALYGNSSGGVIQMLTENVPKTPEVGATVMFGSDNTKRQSVRAAGTSEGIEYLVNYSNFESDGYRDNSASRKEQGTAKFKINFSEDTKLTTLVNWFDQKAQDPGGLGRNAAPGEPSAFNDPKAVSQAALRANTRVERSHTQVGFNLEHKVNEQNSINLVTYVGTRDNNQVLAFNPTGSNARSSQISREFYGTDLRWDNKGEFMDKPYTLSAGLNYGKSTDARTDTNIQINGAPANVLNRDENNISRNFDQYIQAKWSVLENFDIHAGTRHTRVSLEIEDNLIAGPSGDNSGSAVYKKTTPVIGAVWKLNPAINLYANFGKGFETPTFVEAAYATTAATSLPNLTLKPSESKNFEVGAKAFIGNNTRANLTLFNIKTDDEIVIQDNFNGRTTYTNANKTERNGAELSIDSQLRNNFSVYGAYTLLNAKFDSAYTNALGTSIASGNIIPGTYHTQIYGEMAWKHPSSGFRTALEARHNSKAYVSDTNSDSAPSYTIYNVRAGFEQQLKKWRLSEYLRIENLFDKDYIGSVRINDGNGRFFEPASGRTYLVGLSANYSF